MPTLVAAPSRIEAAGNKPKIIEEYIGRVNSRQEALSIARMQSPPGWAGSQTTRPREAAVQSNNAKPKKPWPAKTFAPLLPPDRRLEQLRKLANDFRQRGMSRQSAAVQAYLELAERGALPRRFCVWSQREKSHS